MRLVTSSIVYLETVTNNFLLLNRIVNKLNNSIGQDPESKCLIGVLDIYGFESFKTNRCLTGMLLFSSFTEVYDAVICLMPSNLIRISIFKDKNILMILLCNLK